MESESNPESSSAPKDKEGEVNNASTATATQNQIPTPVAAPVAARAPSPSISNSTANTARTFGGAQAKCKVCTKSVYVNEKIEYDGMVWHDSCFRCMSCKSIVIVKNVAMISGDLYCKTCFKKIFTKEGKYSSFSNKTLTGSALDSSTNQSTSANSSSEPSQDNSSTAPATSASGISLTVQTADNDSNTSSITPTNKIALPVSKSPTAKSMALEAFSNLSRSNSSSTSFRATTLTSPLSVSSLAGELNDARNKITELEQQITLLKNSQSNTNNSTDNAQANDNNKEAINKLTRERDLAVNELKDLLNQLEISKKNLNEANEKFNKLKNESQKQSVELENGLTSRIVSLEKELEAKQNLLNLQINENKSLTKQRDLAINELEASFKKSSQPEIKEPVTTNNSQSPNQEPNEQIQILGNEVTQLKQLNQELTHQKDGLSARNAALESDIENLNKKLSILENLSSAEKAAKEKEIESLTNQRDFAIRELKEVNQKYQEQTKVNSGDDKQSEIIQLNSRIDSLTQKLKDSEDLKKKFEKEILDIAAENKANQKKQAEYQAQVNELSTKLASVTQQRDLAIRELRDSDEKLRKAQEKVDALNQKVNSLPAPSASNGSSGSGHNRSSSSYDEINSKYEGLLGELKSLTSESVEANKKLNLAQSNLKNAKDQAQKDAKFMQSLLGGAGVIIAVLIAIIFLK